MSYPEEFYDEHIRHQDAVSKERRIVRDYPPPLSDSTRELLMAPEAAYGVPGSGKSVSLAFYAIERYANVHRPELGIPRGMKIVWIDLLGKGEMACLPAGSLVFGDDGPKPIETVDIGDRVIGHDGLYHPVTKTFQRHFNGKLVVITPSNFGMPVALTPDHLVLTSKIPKVTPHGRKQPELARVCWKPACEVNMSDHVGIPYYWAASKRTELRLSDFLPARELLKTRDGFILPNLKRSTKTRRVRLSSVPKNRFQKLTVLSDKVPLSPSFMKLLGLFVAEGATTNVGSEVRWCFGAHETNIGEFVCRTMKAVFGLSCKSRFYESSLIVYTQSRILVKIFRRWFGERAAQKQVPKWILALKSVDQVPFLEGLWRGDGCYALDKHRNMPHMILGTASFKLVYGVFTMLCRLRISSRIDWKLNSSIKGSRRNLIYRVLVTGSNARKLGLLLGYPVTTTTREMRHNHHALFEQKNRALLWVRPQKIERALYDGKVFNLEVNESGSYSVPIAVHNCASVPIDEKHPVYQEYLELGGVPQEYPVEVFQPLVFVNGKPYLQYKQPKIVTPFSLCLQSLTAEDWKIFLAPPTPSQERLHDTVVKELRAKPEWPEVTMDDLYATAQGMLGSRRPGFSRSIEGLETADSIPLASHTYSSREAAGLLQRYEKLMNLSIIMPERWKGKRVETNLDIEHMLRREVKWKVAEKTHDLWPISVFLLPDIDDAPFLNYALANYVLMRIFWLKHPNTSGRVTTPVSVVIPEASKAIPREIRDKPKRHFIEPLKNTVLKLAQQAPGFGIQLSIDAQRPLDIDEGFRDTNANLRIFDLGENAAETIRELLRNRYVSNYKEITDENSHFLAALREPGTFIYLARDSSYAELASHCLLGFWYPRASGGSGESETSFHELFRRKRPNDWVDIAHMYSALKVINLEAQNRAAVTMREMLEKEEADKKEKNNKKKRSYEHPEDKVVLGFILDLVKESGLDHWDSYEDFVKQLSQKASIPRARIWQILAKFNSQYLLIDRTEGKKRQRITLLVDRIREALNPPSDGSGTDL